MRGYLLKIYMNVSKHYYALPATEPESLILALFL